MTRIMAVGENLLHNTKVNQINRLASVPFDRNGECGRNAECKSKSYDSGYALDEIVANRRS